MEAAEAFKDIADLLVAENLDRSGAHCVAAVPRPRRRSGFRTITLGLRWDEGSSPPRCARNSELKPGLFAGVGEDNSAGAELTPRTGVATHASHG